jgi:hypothetical protein
MSIRKFVYTKQKYVLKIKLLFFIQNFSTVFFKLSKCWKLSFYQQTNIVHVNKIIYQQIHSL